MQSTSSVAQGTFLSLPKGFSLSKLRFTKKRKLEKPDFLWEIAFNKIWLSLNQDIQEINEQLFNNVLQDIIDHLKKLHNDVTLTDGVIPCKILLTGINLPEHKLLLSTFIHNVNVQITPYVASLWSQSCGTIKSTVQNFVSQLIPNLEDYVEHLQYSLHFDEGSFPIDSSDESNDNDAASSKMDCQMCQYSFTTLASWYDEQCDGETPKRPIIIIICDFEDFSSVILGEFILLLSAYASKLPFILVFGVATTPMVVYQNLSQNVLSHLATQLFKSEPSTILLNNVIENILFSERCPFRLGKNCLTFLTDVFLFNSFSVSGFIQGFKYCLIEHFYKRNHFALCCPVEDILSQANELSAEDVERIRKLGSFQDHVATRGREARKALLLDDDRTRKIVSRMVKNVLDHTRVFHIALKILYVLTSDLPKAPLGRNLIDYYCKSVSDKIRETRAYKDCFKLLELQSQDEIITKIDNLVKLVKSVHLTSSNKKDKMLKDFLIKLERFKEYFQNLRNEPPSEVAETEGKRSFEVLRKIFLDHVNGKVLKELLSPPCELPLYEVIYFDDLTTIRRRISGSPVGAIHLALNNPQCYLNCECCVLSKGEEIPPTLPDLSILYKIHLEYNNMINLHDLFKSFVSIVKQGSSGEDEEYEDKQIQARFTRAVSDLQHLGFIQQCYSKADHVSKVTRENSGFNL